MNCGSTGCWPTGLYLQAAGACSLRWALPGRPTARSAGELVRIDGGGHRPVRVHREMEQDVLLAQRPVGAVQDDVVRDGDGGVAGVHVLAEPLGQVAGVARLARVVWNERDRAGRRAGHTDGAVLQVSGVDDARENN